MKVDQIVSDTIAVTEYLRERFDLERVYLMAHSGGTFFSLQAVARAPELYHAYLAVGQIVYQLRSENVAYHHMVKRFQEAGDVRMVRRLESEPPTMALPLPRSYMLVRDKAMHTLGVGTTRDMRSVIAGVFLPSLVSRDYTVMLPETKAVFSDLEAPAKGFYTFEGSAHSPMLEEPDRMRQIIEEDVQNGENSLADRIYRSVSGGIGLRGEIRTSQTNYPEIRKASLRPRYLARLTQSDRFSISKELV